MKLLYKTTRDYLLASVSILVFTGITLFAVLQKEVGDEMDEQLELQVHELYEQGKAGNFMDSPFLTVKEVSATVPESRIFGDTLLFDRVQQVTEEYHYLKEVKSNGLERYEILAMTSHIGWDKYYLSILYIFILTAVLLTGSGVVINYLSNKKIWAPFFQNLRNVKQFSVSAPSRLQLQDSIITEFKELNLTLDDLTERSRKEYLSLREFTENASHEIQTPLSIIQSKLDRMSQLEVSAEMAHYIVEAKSGVERLVKMNKSLLFLAKLDNNVFAGHQEVEVGEVLTLHMSNMEELFATKGIIVDSIIEPIRITAEKDLMDTLLSNLLSNVVRYTPAHGKARVKLENYSLEVANSGPPLDFPADKIFERFSKSSANITSTGLGLAIVKEICLLHKWDIRYGYKEGWHSFFIQFQ